MSTDQQTFDSALALAAERGLTVTDQFGTPLTGAETSTSERGDLHAFIEGEFTRHRGRAGGSFTDETVCECDESDGECPGPSSDNYNCTGMCAYCDGEDETFEFMPFDCLRLYYRDRAEVAEAFAAILDEVGADYEREDQAILVNF